MNKALKRYFLILLSFSLLGLVASIAMTHLHYRIGAQGFLEKSYCHVSEFFDCDTAMASRYAQIGRFLTSEVGVLYYLLVFMGVLTAWSSESLRRATLSFLALSSLFALGYSLVLATLSFLDLGVLCLLCLMTYIANLGLVLTFPPAMGLRYRDLPPFVSHYVRSLFVGTDFKPQLLAHLGVALAFFGTGLGFFYGLNREVHKAHAEVPREAYLQFFRAQPVEEIRLAGRPSWGPEGAPVEVIEFSDFQCPFCRRAAFSLKPYLKVYRGDVRFVFANYPLDNSCNPNVQHSMHPVACLVAKGAICAQKMGRFWDFHDQVFEKQKKLSRSTLVGIAKGVGLDVQAFEQCLVSEETATTLSADVEEGSRLKVQGTPTVFINGRLFRDWLHPDRLRLVVEAERDRPAPP